MSTTLPTIKPCRRCVGAHYDDNGRFCWTQATHDAPIKPTRKELADLAARGLTINLRIDTRKWRKQ